MPNNRYQRRPFSLETLNERALMAADLGFAIETPVPQASFATEMNAQEQIEIEVAAAAKDGNEDDSGEVDCCEFYVSRLRDLRDSYAERYEENDTHDRDLLNAWDRLKEAVEAIERDNPNAAATALRRAGQSISNLDEHRVAGFVYAQAAIGYDCGDRDASAQAMKEASAVAYETAEAAAEETNDGEVPS